MRILIIRRHAWYFEKNGQAREIEMDMAQSLVQTWRVADEVMAAVVRGMGPHPVLENPRRVKWPAPRSELQPR